MPSPDNASQRDGSCCQHPGVPGSCPNMFGRHASFCSTSSSDAPGSLQALICMAHAQETHTTFEHCGHGCRIAGFRSRLCLPIMAWLHFTASKLGRSSKARKDGAACCQSGACCTARLYNDTARLMFLGSPAAVACIHAKLYHPSVSPAAADLLYSCTASSAQERPRLSAYVTRLLKDVTIRSHR